MSHKNQKKNKQNHVFDMPLEEQLVKTFIGKDQVATIKNKYKVDIILIKPPEDSEEKKWTLRVTGKKNRVQSAAIELNKRHEKMYKVIMGLFETISKKAKQTLQEPLVEFDQQHSECGGCHDCETDDSISIERENKIISHDNPVQ